MCRLVDDPIAELHKNDPPVQAVQPASERIGSKSGESTAKPAPLAAAQPGISAVQLADQPKSLIQACQQKDQDSLDPALWHSTSVLERDHENRSCLHALMQRGFTSE